MDLLHSLKLDIGERLRNGFGLNVYEAIAVGVISFFVVLLCNDKWQRRRFEKLAAKLAGPKDYPIVGCAFEFTGSTQQIMATITKYIEEYSCEPAVRIWFGSMFFVFIHRPADIQIILNSSVCLEKSFMYRFFQDTVGNGLFTAPADIWRKNHRLISPLFKNNLQKFLNVFIEQNQILVKKLKIKANTNQPFDLSEYIMLSNFNMVFQNILNFDIKNYSEEVNDTIEALHQITEWETLRVFRPWLYLDMINLACLKLTGKSKFYIKVLEFPKKVIHEKKKLFFHQKEAEQPNLDDATNIKNKYNKLLVDLLFELNINEGHYSDKCIEDEIMTFLFAGSETSSITVCSCLLLLAMHQNIQDKVYNEIYDIFGDTDEIVTMDKVHKLVYLEQVFKESLRVYPSVPFTFRTIQDDVKINSDNLVLPKGTICMISPYGTHHWSEIFPDSWSFNPENFSAENIAKRHQYSFIPFGGGPRSCVGSQYSMLSMKTQISTILRNYSVHTSLKMGDVKLGISLLLKHSTGFPVTIQPRNRTPIYN